MASNLTTKDVAALLDVSEATVKRWADDGLLTATKTVGGHRRFSIEVVARLRREQGIAPTSELPIDPSAASSGRKLATSAELKEILLKGHEAKATDVLIDNYLNGQNLPSLFDVTITEAMREIGESWYKGELTVADEHLATRTLLDALPKLKAILVPAGPLGSKAICCGIEGDLHELPVHLAETILESEGWEVINLGPNTPLFSLREMISQMRPQLVCLSGKLLNDPDRAAMDYVVLRKTLDKLQIPIVLGGEAFKENATRTRFPATFYAETFQDLVNFVRSLK